MTQSEFPVISLLSSNTLYIPSGMLKARMNQVFIGGVHEPFPVRHNNSHWAADLFTPRAETHYDHVSYDNDPVRSSQR